MGHYWRIGEVGGPYLRMGSWPSLVLLGLIALLLVVLVAAMLSHRREPARSETDRAAYGNMDGQIRSMLLQAGGTLTQDQIRENLGISVVDVSRELAAMEQRGDIRREWLPLEYTYRVYLVEAVPASPAAAGGPSAQPSSWAPRGQGSPDRTLTGP